MSRFVFMLEETEKDGFCTGLPYEKWTRKDVIFIPAGWTAIIKQGETYSQYRNFSNAEVKVPFSSKSFPGIKVKFFGETKDARIFWMRNVMNEKLTVTNFKSKVYGGGSGDAICSGWFKYHIKINQPIEVLKWYLRIGIKLNKNYMIYSRLAFGEVALLLGMNHTTSKGLFRGDGTDVQKRMAWYSAFKEYLTKDYFVNNIHAETIEFDTQFTKYEKIA